MQSYPTKAGGPIKPGHLQLEPETVRAVAATNATSCETEVQTAAGRPAHAEPMASPANTDKGPSCSNPDI